MERDRLGKIRKSIESLEEHGYEVLEHGTEKLPKAEDIKHWKSFLNTVKFSDCLDPHRKYLIVD